MIPIVGEKFDLPPIPNPLLIKADALARIINSPNLILGEKLEAIYTYLEDFKLYIGQYASCSKGCSYCCCIDVNITSLEAEYLSIKANKPLKRSKSITTGHRSPCPFLSTIGDCSVYKHRPIACRYLFAFGNPENCKPGHIQFEYGSPASNYGNNIFKSIISWLHLCVGDEVRDIRDYFE